MISSLSALDSVGRGVSALDETRGVSSTQPAGAVRGPDFADILAQVSSNAIDTLKAGEAAAISGIQGKASVQEVVEAIMSAEQTLQTAIAIRDKVVAAYQEISRMTI